jgi:hypothetical protein
MIPRIKGSKAALIVFTGLLLSAAQAGAWGSKKPTESSQQQAVKPPAISPKVGNALHAAQEAIQKQDWDGAFAKVQEAQGIASKTPYDDFQIAEMLGYVELKRQHYAEASAAFEQSITSGQLPPAETTERLKLVAQLALQLKDYAKAAKFATRAIESISTPEPELYSLLGQAQYLSESYPASADAMGHAIDAARKAGKPVSENWMQVQLSSYAQNKDAAGVLMVLQQIAVEFPKKKYLNDLFNQWKHDENDDRSVLNLYRLVLQLGLLQDAEDYLRLAQLAVNTGMPGEAVSVLEKGRANKVFTDEVDAEHARRQLEAAKTAAAADRKALQALDQATGGRSAEDEVQLGLALLSFGEYQRGSEALQRGLAQGGIKRPDQTQLLLGEALVKLNRTADAKAAFDSVESSSKLKTVAQLWAAYTSQPFDSGD